MRKWRDVHVYRNLILVLFFEADDARARCGLRIISRAWNQDGIEIESRGGVDGHVLVSIRPSRTRHAIPHRSANGTSICRETSWFNHEYTYTYILLTAEEFHTYAHARVCIMSCCVSCSVGNYLKASTNRVPSNLESKWNCVYSRVSRTVSPWVLIVFAATSMLRYANFPNFPICYIIVSFDRFETLFKREWERNEKCSIRNRHARIFHGSDTSDDTWDNPKLFTPRYAHMLDCNISFTETVFNKYARHATVWITLPVDS